MSGAIVLIVEDDKSVRLMLRFALKEAGFGVTEAATDSEALDLGLPDRASGAVLKRLRATEQAKTTRLSGSPCLPWTLAKQN